MAFRQEWRCPHVALTLSSGLLRGRLLRAPRGRWRSGWVCRTMLCRGARHHGAGPALSFEPHAFSLCILEHTIQESDATGTPLPIVILSVMLQVVGFFHQGNAVDDVRQAQRQDL